MTINPTEISDIIKDKIKNLDIKTQSHNEGTVVSLTDGIARIYGCLLYTSDAADD